LRQQPLPRTCGTSVGVYVFLSSNVCFVTGIGRPDISDAF